MEKNKSNKAAIVAFISPARDNNRRGCYFDEKNESFLVEGVQTNDAPVKFLIQHANKEKQELTKVISVVSSVARENGYEGYKAMVKAAYFEEYGLTNTLMEEQFIEVKYDDKSSVKTNDKATTVFEGVFNALSDVDNILLDCSGGFRDMAFLMMAIARYSEFTGKKCSKLIYSEQVKDDNNPGGGIIRHLDDIYSLFSLISAIDQFVRTSNAAALKSIDRQGDECREEEELINALIEFSNAMSICEIKDIETKLDAIEKAIDRFSTVDAGSNLRLHMLKELSPLITEKMNITGRRNKADRYIGLIKWCVDNGMIQQALTLYQEKMPVYYFEKGYFTVSERPEGDFGKTWQGQAFVELYGRFNELYETKESVLEILDSLEKDPGESIEEYRRKLIIKMKDTLESLDPKRAAKEIKTLKFICDVLGIGRAVTGKQAKQTMRKYDGYGVRVQGKALEIYGRTFSGSNIEKEINLFKSSIDIVVHRAVINDKQKYQDYRAGDKLRRFYDLQYLMNDHALADYDRDIHIKTDCLIELLKYYLAVNLKRNHINHAHEGAEDAADKQASQQLEKMGINMETTTESIEKIIRDGLRYSKAREDIYADKTAAKKPDKTKKSPVATEEELRKMAEAINGRRL